MKSYQTSKCNELQDGIVWVWDMRAEGIHNECGRLSYKMLVPIRGSDDPGP
jgi:hypothetical protein